MSTDAYGPSDLPVYGVAAIRAMEQHAARATLMQEAAAATYALIRRLAPRARRWAIYCGAGGNGGDGMWIARAAWQDGIAVEILADPQTAYPAAREWLRTAGVPFASGVTPDAPDLVIDALLGIGVRGELRPWYAAAIAALQRAAVPVMAVDVPSGVDPHTGSVAVGAVRADHTLMILAAKQGCYTGRALDHVGVRWVLPLPGVVLAPSDLQVLERIPALPQRPQDHHKDSCARVWVFGGGLGMGGAALLAGSAALRAGAGVVGVVVDAAHRSGVLAARPELLCRDWEQEWDPRYSAGIWIVGPGLGRDPAAARLWAQIRSAAVPHALILDGDGLYAWARDRTEGTDPWAATPRILTPHAGEAADLLGWTRAAVEADRIQAAWACQAQYGGIVVLKGPGTLVCNGVRMAICPYGGPYLATAGAGDVLSGVIAAYCAQGMPEWDAAVRGVWQHARAGAALAVRGPGGLASELLAEVPRVA